MLFFLDTETTGLDPSRHDVLEVGLAVVKNGTITNIYHSYVAKPEYTVTPQAMEINKLNLADVAKQGQPEDKVVRQLLYFAKLHMESDSEKLILAGHNVDFDRRMLQAMFHRHGFNIDEVFSYRVLDTAGIIQFLKLAGKLPKDFPNGLHEASKRFGFKEEGKDTSHTVVGDIQRTVFLYNKLLGLVKGDVVYVSY